MPTPRRYKNHAERQAAYRQRLADARSKERLCQSEKSLIIAAAPGRPRWRSLLQQAQLALQQVVLEMETCYEQRSEAWQDSERGEAFLERLEEVREALDATEGLVE